MLLPCRAAKFEDVGEVRIEADGETYGRRGNAEIAQVEPHEHRTVVGTDAFHEMNRIAARGSGRPFQDRGTGEVNDEGDVVVADTRGKKHRPSAINDKCKLRQVTGVFVER